MIAQLDTMVLYLHFTRQVEAMQTNDDDESKRVDAYLSLLTTINNGIEDLLGKASKGLIFGTGVEEGKRIASELPKTDTIQSAITALNNAYAGV